MKKILLVAVIGVSFVSTFTFAATPTPTPHPTPAATPTPHPTPAATPTPHPTPAATPTPHPTPAATPTPHPTPAATPTPTPGANGSGKITCSEYTGAPVANNDVTGLIANEVTTINVQDNDQSEAAIVVASTRLIDDEKNEVTTMYTADKGEWTVDEESGKVLFNPDQDFTGTVTASYVVKDACGNTSNTGTITLDDGSEKRSDKTENTTSDGASVLSAVSMFMIMMFTMGISLLYIRKEEV